MADSADSADERKGTKADPGPKPEDRKAPKKGTEARLRGLARRLFLETEHGDPDEDGEKTEAHIPRDKSEVLSLLSALLETGDKAKTEMVRMTAREVRNYLEALELHKDLLHLITHHSLEVHASFNLKPLNDAAPAPKPPVPPRDKAPDED